MTEEKKKMPIWQRQLIGWPIIVGIASVVGWVATGSWLTGISYILAGFGFVLTALFFLFLLGFLLWIFGVEDEGSGCSW